MKNSIRPILILILILLLFSCKKVFSPGLGDKVDIDKPSISLDSTISNGAYFSGEITLNGTCSDDISVSKITLTIFNMQDSERGSSVVYSSQSSDSTRKVIISQGSSWSCVINTAEVDGSGNALFPDGEKDVLIEVTDGSGKSSTKQVFFIFDNTAPVIFVTQGELDKVITDSEFYLRGEAYDPWRLKSVTVSLVSGTASIGEIESPEAWSSKISQYTSGELSQIDLSFNIVATDRAGNSTSTFYHYDDLKQANNNQNISINNVYRILNGLDPVIATGETAPGLTLASFPAAYSNSNPISYSVDLDLDKPQITISNPNPANTALENTLSVSSSAVGSIEDDDKVDVSSIQVKIDDGDWIAASSVPENDSSFANWSHDLSSLGEGEHTLQVRAQDTESPGVYSTSSVVSFFINKSAASVSITSPVNGAFINSSTLTEISGTATDGGTVSDVEISFDSGTSWEDTSFTAGSNVSWTFDTSSINIADYLDASNRLNISLRAFDGATWAVNGIQITIDDTVPDVEFLSPLKNSEVNGEVTLRVACSDNNQLASVEYKIGENEDWQSVSGNLYNWTRTINSLDYDNPADAIETPMGSGIYRLSVYVRATDIAGNSLETGQLDYYFRINNAADKPGITISNPDETSTDNVLSSSSSALGSASDDDAVDTSSIMILIDGDADETIDGGNYLPVTNVTGSGMFVQWSYDLSGLSTGVHSLKMYVEDINGVYTYSEEVEFTIDPGVPDIVVDSPANGDYLNSVNFTVSGDATSGGTVTNVGISFDNGSSWNPITITEAASVSWSFNTSSLGTPLSAGVVKIKVRASGNNGSSWSYNNLQVIIDTELPTVEFIEPYFDASSGASYVNGEVDIRCGVSDNNQLTKVEIKVGDNRGWVEITDNLYNWTYTINTLEYENSSDGIETPAGSGIYKIYVYVRAIDIAGNVEETTNSDYWFFIDNELDRPTINIISPSADQSLGGSALVTGTTFDDDGPINVVEMQIDVNTASGGTPNFSDTVVLSFPIDFDGPGGETAVTSLDESQWYKVSLDSNQWSTELNTDGQLYSTELGHSGDIHFKVRAQDKSGGADSVYSEEKSLHIKFDDSIPYFDSLLPVSNSYNRGTFDLEGQVIDDESIKHFEISYNGGADWNYVIRDGMLQSPYGSGTVTDTWDFRNGTGNEIQIDTSNIPDVGAITAGELSIRLKVTDITNYQSLSSVRYFIDNIAPTGGSQDFDQLSGTETIYGTAQDSGDVNSVNRVEVFLARDAGGGNYNVYDVLNNDSSTTATLTELQNGSVSSPYKIVVDDTAETLGGSNPDPDGINEEFNPGDPYEWKFNFDTNNIPDGLIEIHFLVYDAAGNSTHYSYSGFIANDTPVITGITVKTDINDDGDYDDTDETVVGYTGSDFKVRNSDFVVEVSYTGGTGTIDVQMVYESDTTDLITSGNSVNITDFSSPVTMNDADNVVYTITVMDSVLPDAPDISLFTADIETSITVDLENTDSDPPSVTVADIDTDDVPFTSGYPDGHVESKNSLNAFNGSDEDISGKVILSGTAQDELRIQEIRAVNLAGTVDIRMAYWSSGALIEDDVNFNITNQNIDDTGHTISWEYTWDTSGKIGLNENISFQVTDFGPNSATNTAKTVDIVPYITKIETSLGSGERDRISDKNRSALGRYPVYHYPDNTEYESIKVYGFNLTGAAFRLSTDPDGVNAGLTAYNGGVALASAFDTDHYNVDLTSMTGSGYLNAVRIDGTDYIPTTNNINDNALVSDDGDELNKEPNIYNNDILTDDRWLELWDINQLGTYNNLRQLDMDMNGDELGFSMGYSDNLYRIINVDTSGAVTSTDDAHRSYTRFFDNAVAFDANSYYYTVSQCGDTLGVPVDGWNLPSHFSFTFRASGTNWEYFAGVRKIFIESNWNGSDVNQLDRVLLPQLDTRTNGTDTGVYLSYYDRVHNLVKFRYFIIGEDSALGYTFDTALNPDRYSSLIPYQSGLVNNNDTEMSVSRQSGGRIQPFFAIAGIQANSIFSATSFLSDGTAVVAWYDGIANSLKLKYLTNPYTAYSGKWAFGVTGNPGADTYAFDLTVDGTTYQDIEFTVGASTNGTRKYEMAYQLNNTLNDGDYGAYAIVDPTTEEITVYSYQSGATSNITISAPTSSAETSLLTYATGGTGTVGGGNAWVEVEVDTDFAGKYVAMTVDGDNNVHLAYQNTSNGDLKYSYITNLTGSRTISTVTVDSYLQVGQYIDITVNQEDVNNDADNEYIPYISYYNISYADTRRAAKLARLVQDLDEDTLANGADPSTDMYTGNWEVMILPAYSAPVQYRVNIGFRSNGDLVIAYQGDYIEYLVYQP